MHNKDLITELQNCANACDTCATACLEEDNVKMLSRCIQLDMDCADVCTLAARLLQRDSEVAQDILEACEAVCDLCAEECEKHQDMHEHCRVCAEACKRCAEACRNYETA